MLENFYIKFHSVASFEKLIIYNRSPLFYRVTVRGHWIVIALFRQDKQAHMSPPALYCIFLVRSLICMAIRKHTIPVLFLRRKKENVQNLKCWGLDQILWGAENAVRHQYWRERLKQKYPHWWSKYRKSLFQEYKQLEINRMCFYRTF